MTKDINICKFPRHITPYSMLKYRFLFKPTYLFPKAQHRKTTSSNIHINEVSTLSHPIIYKLNTNITSA